MLWGGALRCHVVVRGTGFGKRLRLLFGWWELFGMDRGVWGVSWRVVDCGVEGESAWVVEGLRWGMGAGDALGGSYSRC